MLTMSKDQMDIFEDIQRYRFRDEMRVHFEQFYPDQTQDIDKEQFSTFIIDSIKEAQDFGLESKKRICIFLNIKVLMKVSEPFNRERHGWVLDIMADYKIGNVGNRLDKLSDVVDAQLKRMEGGVNDGQ